MNREAERRDCNKDRIFRLLVSHGAQGATNSELLQVGGFRYGARIFELRREGWEIETIPSGEGLYRFVLKGRVEVQPTLFAEMKPCEDTNQSYPD